MSESRWTPPAEITEDTVAWAEEEQARLLGVLATIEKQLGTNAQWWRREELKVQKEGVLADYRSTKRWVAVSRGALVRASASDSPGNILHRQAAASRDIEIENDRLYCELEAAKARIAELEAQLLKEGQPA